MKKVIYCKDLCCKKCAERLTHALELSGLVVKAHASVKKNAVYILEQDGVAEEELIKKCGEMGFEVLSIEKRKGLFE